MSIYLPCGPLEKVTFDIFHPFQNDLYNTHVQLVNDHLYASDNIYGEKVRSLANLPFDFSVKSSLEVMLNFLIGKPTEDGFTGIEFESSPECTQAVQTLSCLTSQYLSRLKNNRRVGLKIDPETAHTLNKNSSTLLLLKNALDHNP